MKRLQNAVVYALLFLVLCLIMPRYAASGDTAYWIRWSDYIFHNGLINAYKSETNYMPLYQYVMFFFGLFFTKAQAMAEHIYLLKIITLAFDFIGALLIGRIVYEKYKDSGLKFKAPLFYLLNFAVLFNSLIWAQVDGIMATLTLISIYFSLKERVFISGVFLLLAINMKLQGIAFIPLYLLIIFPAFLKQVTAKKFFTWAGGIILIQLLIILPFVIGGDLRKLGSVVITSFGSYPMVSVMAYNIWYWLMPENPSEISNKIRVLGISYKNWGTILFIMTSLVALFPIIKKVFMLVFGRSSQRVNDREVFICGALISLIFFFFNTEMHERYSHPALIFLALYSVYTGRYLVYVITSLAYIINLESVIHFFKLGSYQGFIFNPRFVAVIYFIAILLLYIDMYEIRVRKLFIRSRAEAK